MHPRSTFAAARGWWVVGGGDGESCAAISYIFISKMAYTGSVNLWRVVAVSLQKKEREEEARELPY
jgi:hypothetical protein